MRLNSSSGVSESIGFILILGMVISGIALVTLFGYPLLLKEQANANVRNMEKGMIVLQNDIKSIAYKSVPFKETTLLISGGSLSLKRPAVTPSFTITYPGLASMTVAPGELEYQSDSGNQVVILENGAVIVRQWDASGSSMLAEPRWFYDDTTKTFVIPLIRLNASSNLSRNGIGTVQMKIVTPPNSIEYLSPGGTVQVTYNMDIQNNHLDAWNNYFVNSLQMHDNAGIYEKFNVDRLVVTTYDITILTL